MTKTTHVSDYQTKHLGQLLGKRVAGLVHSPATQYDESTYGLRFDDGSIAWIMRDPEGNGPGHLDIEKAGR